MVKVKDDMQSKRVFKIKYISLHMLQSLRQMRQTNHKFMTFKDMSRNFKTFQSLIFAAIMKDFADFKGLAVGTLQNNDCHSWFLNGRQIFKHVHRMAPE